jgi:predicted GNAT superfamily acetyltransferase
VDLVLKLLSDPREIDPVIDLQNYISPEDFSKRLSKQWYLTTILNGGLCIAAYPADDLFHPIGFVFGYPGFYNTPDGPRLLHVSYSLGIHPDFHNRGIGFRLKRAQWQMVRHQGVDRIICYDDPLLSCNAKLNITKSGGVCNTLIENIFGETVGETGIYIPSDRLLVDWWVNSERVKRRLSRQARRPLDLAHFLAAGIQIINPTHLGVNGLPHPSEIDFGDNDIKSLDCSESNISSPPMVVVEIPADYPGLLSKDKKLALDWRMHTRAIFSSLFQAGYLVTDFIHLKGSTPRSFYALSYGESTF